MTSKVNSTCPWHPLTLPGISAQLGSNRAISVHLTESSSTSSSLYVFGQCRACCYFNQYIVCGFENNNMLWNAEISRIRDPHGSRQPFSYFRNCYPKSSIRKRYPPSWVSPIKSEVHQQLSKFVQWPLAICLVQEQSIQMCYQVIDVFQEHGSIWVFVIL